MPTYTYQILEWKNYRFFPLNLICSGLAKARELRTAIYTPYGASKKSERSNSWQPIIAI